MNPDVDRFGWRVRSGAAAVPLCCAVAIAHQFRYAQEPLTIFHPLSLLMLAVLGAAFGYGTEAVVRRAGSIRFGLPLSLLLVPGLIGLIGMAWGVNAGVLHPETALITSWSLGAPTILGYWLLRMPHLKRSHSPG